MEGKRKAMETSEQREKGFIKLLENSNALLQMDLNEELKQFDDVFEPKFAVLNELPEFNDLKNQISKLRVDDENEVYKIDSICKRLSLIEEVIMLESIGTWGLCVYLYLTCFDSLGQKERYTDFGDWIDKKKNEKVSELICSCNKTDEQTLKLLISRLYKSWKEIFGVKNSFYNFMNSIEDSCEFIELLKCIEPQSKTDEEIVIEFKKGCLFNFRNKFTHNTKNSQWPTKGDDFWLYTKTDYKNKEYDVSIRIPSILAKLKNCVILGIRRRIEEKIANK